MTMRIIGSGNSVSKDRVLDLFTEFGFSAPSDYVDFVTRTNGGVPDTKTFPISDFYDISSSEIEYFLEVDSNSDYKDLRAVLERLRSQLPDMHIPIASTSCDNFLVMSCDNNNFGRILYFDLQERNPENVFAALFPVAKSLTLLFSNLT